MGKISQSESFQEIKALLDLLGVKEFDSFVKMSNRKILLGDDIEGGIHDQLLEQFNNFNFSILRSENIPFITSDFPILFDSMDTKNGKLNFNTLFFSISPQFAVIYSIGRHGRPYRNRVIDATDKVEDVGKLNNWYAGQNIERSKYLFSHDKEFLKRIVAENGI